MSIQSNSIITQVSQGGGGNYSSFYDNDNNDDYENIQLNLRGVLFTISREELLRLPESILIGITNSAVYDPNSDNNNNINNSNTISPECFQYTLDVFRSAAKGLLPTLLSIDEDFDNNEYVSGVTGTAVTSEDVGSQQNTVAYPTDTTTLPSPSPSSPPPPQADTSIIYGVEDSNQSGESAQPQQATTDELQQPLITETVSDISEILRRRPAIIVLREDLDYYCLPNSTSLTAQSMRKLKQDCGEAILNQRNIFSGLRKGKTENSPEHHLISMLCSSGFKLEDEWGFRAREPHTTVISSLALIRLQTIETNEEQETQELSTPQKLLLFWRKPARKCWWDSIELDNIPGIEGTIRVHVRRVWTLELSVIGVR